MTKPIRKGTKAEADWGDAHTTLLLVTPPAGARQPNEWTRLNFELRRLLKDRMEAYGIKTYGMTIEWDPDDQSWDIETEHSVAVRYSTKTRGDVEVAGYLWKIVSDRVHWTLRPPPPGHTLLEAVELLLEEIAAFTEACELTMLGFNRADMRREVTS